MCFNMANNITIDGLTPRQKVIAELLWSCESVEQLKTIISQLPTLKDRADAATIMEIMIHESMENEFGLDDYESITNDIIDGIR